MRECLEVSDEWVDLGMNRIYIEDFANTIRTTNACMRECKQVCYFASDNSYYNTEAYLLEGGILLSFWSWGIRAL